MMTSVTERALRCAQARGFSIRTTTAGGRTIHYLSQQGEDGTFGAIVTGRRSGRITGALLHHGNHDARGTHYRGALATARAIRETAERPREVSLWSVREQGAGVTVSSSSGDLSVTHQADTGQWVVRWAGQDQVLHLGEDLEAVQRWAERHAEAARPACTVI